MKINWGTGTEMTQRVCGIAVILALLSVASTAMCQQYYIYSPKAVSAEARSNKADGEILVSEIVVKKGDTLSGISRKFSGKAFYYPQILLFNDIKNPNLIYTGDTIRIPVKTELAVGTESKSGAKLSGKASAAKPKKQKSTTQITTASDSSTQVKSANVGKPVSKDQTPSEQQLFNQAFVAYNLSDCRAAIAKFDQLLKTNPDSQFAADANLYKADCLLKLSGQ